MAEKSVIRQLRQQRVVLFPFPFHGHINPMLELAAVLEWRCFSVTIFHTDYNNDAIDPTKYPCYRFVWIPDGICKQASSSHQDRVLSLIGELNEKCRMLFHEALGQVLCEKAAGDGDIEAEAEAEAVPWLVLDMHWYRMNEVAKELGVPTLVLRTGSAASLNGFIALPALYRKGILPAKAESEQEETVEELAPLRVRDMIAVGKNSRELVEFVELDVENARSSRGVIINTSWAIEAAELEKVQRELSLPAFAVGPLHKFEFNNYDYERKAGDGDGDEEVWRWLERQPRRSVVYVSFGSLACMEGEEAREMAWGLADAGQPFLWALRPGSVGAAEELAEVRRAAGGGRGMIVAWAPQREVLRHEAVGGFWTHAGWNSTVEAMAEGVPLLCTPFFADQMGNARYAAEAWGVAAQILRRPLRRGAVERAVRGLLRFAAASESESASAMRQLLARSVQSDGSSYRALDHLVRFLQTRPHRPHVPTMKDEG